MMRLASACFLLAGCDSALIAYGFCGHPMHARIELDGELPAGVERTPTLVRARADDLIGRERSISFFVGESCEPLPHQIEAFDPEVGELAAWVALTSAEPFFLAFGGRGAEEKPLEVFASYLGVWHFGEASGDAIDSSPGRSPGTVEGRRVDGVAGGGVWLSNDEVIDFGDRDQIDFGLADSFAFGGWFNRTDFTTSWQQPIQKGGTNASTEGYAIEIDIDGDRMYPCLSAGDGQHATPCTVESRFTRLGDGWTYVVAVVDRDEQQMLLYRNGAIAQTEPIEGIDPNPPNNYRLQVGHRSYPFGGIVDEVRIIDSALSQEQLIFEFENQRPDSTMLRIGSVEAAP